MQREEFLRRQQDLFDLPISRRERNMAIKRNEDGSEEWRGQALTAFIQFGISGVHCFITEDFRQWWMSRGTFVAPRHPNAWGAFTAGLAKAKVIRATGNVRPASSVRSHARKMLEWEIVLARPS